jgi:hypothetical protein
MRWLGDSGEWTYQVWRAAGALALLFGFFALARLVLRDRTQRLIALLMCAFGGGFLWVAFAAGKVLGPSSPVLAYLPRGLALDLEVSMHPFNEILINPHFSLPLGLLLFFFAWYVAGELTGSARCYAIAAALAALEGMIRPYDLIALFAIIPLFILIETAVARELQLSKLAMRVLPLVAVSPVLLYNIYIFKYHPVFKFWGSQGNSTAIGVGPHLVFLGLAGVLVAIRVCRLRTFPLKTSAERLLLVWLASVFFLCHAHKLPIFQSMPYTFQLVTTLMPPVILPGVPVFDPARWLGWSRRGFVWPQIVASFIAINALSSIWMVYRYSREMKDYHVSYTFNT